MSFKHISVFSAAFLVGMTACASLKPAQDNAQITVVQDTYVSAAAIPIFTDYLLVKTNMGQLEPQAISLDKMLDELSLYDAIFAGEAHGHIGNHRAQADVLAGLQKRHGAMTLSMEQFDRPRQSVLDDYLAGNIGEQTLIDNGKAWEGYTQSYRPLIEFAKQKNLPVLAANAPIEIVRCVGERGAIFLNTLDVPERSWAAQSLDLSGGAYKDKFYDFMQGGHHGADDDEDSLLKTYAAQVTRDQTMAQTIAAHMTSAPQRKVMHINGSFHSSGLLGTPERLQSALPDIKIANIHPVLVDDPGAPSFTARDAAQGHYLLLLQNTPKRFVQMKNINAFIANAQNDIAQHKCAY